MGRISVTEYAFLKEVKRDTIHKRIQKSIFFGTNKLADGSFFEKVGHNYIIELNDELELNSQE